MACRGPPKSVGLQLTVQVMRIWRDSATDGNITIFPEADATHMDLLSEHSLTKWTCINVSDSEGCIDLSGPVPAMLDISPPDQKCPVSHHRESLAAAWVDSSAQGSDTCLWRAAGVLSPLRNGAAAALTSSVCFGLASFGRWEWIQFGLAKQQVCFVLLLRGKTVAPKQGAFDRNMPRDVGADESLPALDMENLPEPALQPMAGAAAITTKKQQYPPRRSKSNHPKFGT